LVENPYKVFEKIRKRLEKIGGGEEGKVKLKG